MREYIVAMPIAGVVYLTVQAESEKQAIEKFYEDFDTLDKADSYEWDFYKKMSQGNLRYYNHDTVEVEDNGEIEPEGE